MVKQMQKRVLITVHYAMESAIMGVWGGRGRHSLGCGMILLFA